MSLFSKQTDSGAPFEIKNGGRVVVQTPSFNPNGPKIYWWAKMGMVCCWIEPGAVRPITPENNEPEYLVMTWQTAAERWAALVASIVTNKTPGRGSANYYPEVRRREEKLCRELGQVIRDAIEQVPPGTDECIKAREASSPKTVILPSTFNFK